MLPKGHSKSIISLHNFDHAARYQVKLNKIIKHQFLSRAGQGKSNEQNEIK
jgi:hypothetical protein